MAKETVVPRPAKRSEYVLKYATKQSEKGWRDLVATIRNPMSETWDFLTRTPLTTTPTNYPLEGSLSAIKRGRPDLPALAAQAHAQGHCTGVVLRRRQHRLPGTGPHRAPQRDQVAGHGNLSPRG